MPFNCKVFYVDDEEEASLTAAGNKKQQADEHKSAKNGSKKTATDGGKTNVPKEANKPKVAVKPIEKPVHPTNSGNCILYLIFTYNRIYRHGNALVNDFWDDTEPKRVHRHPGATAIGPTPPGFASIPLAVHQPSIRREFSWDDDKQIPGKSPRHQLRSKGEDDDGNSKMLHNNLDSGRRKLEQKGPEDPGKLVLKMRLHCEGCNRKVRQDVKKFKGVVAVDLDADSDLVTVTGTVNREKLVSYLKQKLKQEIEVVLPAGPDNDREAAAVMDRQDTRWQKPEVSADDNGRRKVEEDTGIAASQKTRQLTLPESVKVRKEEPRQSTSNAGAGQGRESDSNKLEISSTLTLRIRLHCDGCIDKIRDAIKRFKDVESVEFHKDNDLVAVAGNVDMRELVPYLEDKLKCKVEVVPRRRSSALVDEKQRRKPQPACGKKVSKDVHQVTGRAGGESPVERATLATLPPTYEKDVNEKGNSSSGTGNELPPPVGWNDGMPCALYNRLYQNSVFEMFSDENANACSIL